MFSTALGGCSFAFVDGPPPNHRTSPFFDCTASNTLPVLDTVASTIGLLDAVSFATGSNDASTATGSRKGDAIAFGAGAALLAASAAYGYRKTSECREAEADLVRRSTLAPVSPFAPRAPQGPQGSYDPWVPHPAAPTVIPQVPAAPQTAPVPGSPARDWEAPNK